MAVGHPFLLRIIEQKAICLRKGHSVITLQARWTESRPVDFHYFKVLKSFRVYFQVHVMREVYGLLLLY